MTNFLIKIATLALLLALCAGLSAQFSGGSGTYEDPYQVATTADLDNVRSYYPSHFLQTADIDLGVAPYNENQGWIPICDNEDIPFSGSYDGAGFSISNLLINDSGLGYAGLFGWVVGGTLENIVLLNVNVTCNDSGGALAGECFQSDVTGCFASGAITGDGPDTGGMFGTVKSFSNVSHCSTDMIVSGGHYAGGLISWVDGHCVVSNCSAVGTVTGLDGCGGLVGDLIGSTLSTSYALSQVSAQTACGGLVGLCREYATISDCFSRSQVTANAFAGGICGTTDYTSSLTNCYSASTFTVGSNYGGITGGETTSPITGCYWDVDLSGPMNNTYGEGRSTLQMTYPYAADTYVGWDFATIWHSDETGTQNAGYPFLWAEPSGIADDSPPLPEFWLLCYPNPFTESTKLACSLTKPGDFLLTIYDTRGRLVRSWKQYAASHGEYQVTWEGRDSQGAKLPSGIYFLRLTQNGKSATQRLVLLK